MRVADVTAGPAKRGVSMKCILLETASDIHERQLYTEISNAENQRIKVYSTVVRRDPMSADTIITTSKEVHLALGTLSEFALSCLVTLIHEKLMGGESILIKVHDGDKYGFLATVTYPRGTIHLSRASS